ncbi:gephyrin-like molybdotransferase Glp [Rubrivirga sp. IMCC45206]|uniref:molybdopterin molybdotransferase MoeA n=1 Tax=Rubrivirga sp. IMCC45206 TaxID=3391614 RepID=UPI00398FE3A9
MGPLVSVDHARRTVLGLAQRLGAESVPLADAVGRTLAAAVTGGPLPPFAASAMDGYAVRAADGTAARPVSGDARAGSAPAPLPPGTAMWITTGAPIPSGADAVVPVERTTREGDAVRLDAEPQAGQFIRPEGSALAAGSVVLAQGAVVTPGALALLAGAGAATVAVAREPRVAVLATGDEVVPAGTPLAPGQIWDANGPGLAAQAVAAGGAVVGPFRTGDTLGALSDAIERCASADVLVFAGGVSMGDRDLVREAVEAAGGEWRVWGVRQRPGKPLAVGVLGGRPVLGLPGNPVSAAVCFEVYARPLLAAMLGRDANPEFEPAVLTAPFPKAAGLYTFARAIASRDADGQLALSPAGAQDSHVARSLAASDGLAHLPAEWADAPAGAVVRFERWPW